MRMEKKLIVIKNLELLFRGWSGGSGGPGVTNPSACHYWTWPLTELISFASRLHYIYVCTHELEAIC